MFEDNLNSVTRICPRRVPGCFPGALLCPKMSFFTIFRMFQLILGTLFCPDFPDGHFFSFLGSRLPKNFSGRIWEPGTGLRFVLYCQFCGFAKKCCLVFNVLIFWTHERVKDTVHLLPGLICQLLPFPWPVSPSPTPMTHHPKST